MNIEIPETMRQPIEDVTSLCGLSTTEVADFLKREVKPLPSKHSILGEYKTELTQAEFLTIPAANWVAPIIDTPATLGEVAEKMINDYDGNFDNLPDANRDIGWCAWLQKHWDWEKVGEIPINQTGGRLQAGDGNHRRVTLAVMCSAGQTQYSPLPFRFITAEALSKEERDTQYSEKMQAVIDRHFTTIIDEPDTLLKMPCAFTPLMPDLSMSWRTMQEWVQSYRSTPDTLRHGKQGEAYQDMKLHVENFDPEAVKFLTAYDLNFATIFHGNPHGNPTLNRKLPILLKRHKWIAAQFIRGEQWQPMAKIPNLFLVD